MIETEAMRVLDECKAVMAKKANDYQNPRSSIKQADYYPNGCMTILDIMHAKMLRLRSVMEAMQHDPNYMPNFESIEDSAKDLINYASFLVSFSRNKMDGQKPNHDFLNRPIKLAETPTPQYSVKFNLNEKDDKKPFPTLDYGNVK